MKATAEKENMVFKLGLKMIVEGRKREVGGGVVV